MVSEGALSGEDGRLETILAALRTSADKTRKYFIGTMIFYIVLIAVFAVLVATVKDPKARGADIGILILVSLLEHRVQVLADSGINARVKPGTWDEVVEIILAGIRRGDLCQGLCDAIDRCGEILGREFPIQPDDVNELPDRLRKG